MDTKTLIPLLAPFITILLGFISIPFIEMYKSRHSRNQLLRSLLEELKDEVFTIDIEFKTLYSFHKNIRDMSENKLNLKRFSTVTPYKLKIYSVEKLLDNHFEKLPTEVRRSIKNLKESTDHLNSLADQLKDLNDEVLPDIFQEKNDVPKLINTQRNYLTNILIYRYNTQYLLSILSDQSTDLKIFSDIDINESISMQLKDMGIEEGIQVLIGNKEKPEHLFVQPYDSKNYSLN